jgi:hypothetical protein
MGGQGSGGPNGGPQYNPANVSGTGGNGQSGNYTGFGYGQNSELNNSRIQGNQAVNSVKATGATTGGAQAEPTLPSLGSLTDGVSDGLPMTAGVDVGPGVGSAALPKGMMGLGNTRPNENAAIIKNYLPDLALAARSKDAPDSFKRFVNFLMEQNG